MRWTVFAVFAFAMLVLEVSLRNTLRLDSLRHGVSPSFVACLLVLVLMFAPRLAALWACWILGVAMDLMPGADGLPTRVIGPYALGYVFAGMVLLPLRTMVFRRRALTFGAMAFVFSLATSVVVVFLLTIRHWYPSSSTADYSGLQHMVFKFFESLYTGALAIPLGWMLLLSLPLWGFQAGSPRRW